MTIDSGIPTRIQLWLRDTAHALLNRGPDRINKASFNCLKTLRPVAIQVRDRAGQSTVEFAMVFPVVLLVFIGITDLGRGIYYYNTVSYLAREGTRAGVVLAQSASWNTMGNRQGTYTSIGTYAGTNTIVGRIASQAGSLDTTVTRVIISTPVGTLRQAPVSVQVEYPFSPIFVNWIGSGPTINLHASATMRIE